MDQPFIVRGPSPNDTGHIPPPDLLFRIIHYLTIREPITAHLRIHQSKEALQVHFGDRGWVKQQGIESVRARRLQGKPQASGKRKPHLRLIRVSAQTELLIRRAELSQQRRIGSEPVGLLRLLESGEPFGSHGLCFQIAPEDFYAETHLTDLGIHGLAGHREIGERLVKGVRQPFHGDG